MKIGQAQKKEEKRGYKKVHLCADGHSHGSIEISAVESAYSTFISFEFASNFKEYLRLEYTHFKLNFLATMHYRISQECKYIQYIP